MSIVALTADCAAGDDIVTNTSTSWSNIRSTSRFIVDKSKSASPQMILICSPSRSEGSSLRASRGPSVVSFSSALMKPWDCSISKTPCLTTEVVGVRPNSKIAIIGLSLSWAAAGASKRENKTRNTSAFFNIFGLLTLLKLKNDNHIQYSAASA